MIFTKGLSKFILITLVFFGCHLFGVSVVSTTPTNGHPAASLSGPIQITFSSNITASTGQIIISNTLFALQYTGIATNTNFFQIAGNTLNINLNSMGIGILSNNTFYTVTITSNAISNFGSYFFSFTTLTPLIANSILDGYSGYPVGDPLIITFNTPPVLLSGMITLSNLSSSYGYSFPSTDTGAFFFSNTTLTINKSYFGMSPLQYGCNYRVTLSPSAFENFSGKSFNFSTESTPPAPFVSFVTPANGHPSASINSDLSITFDQPIVRSFGMVHLSNETTGAVHSYQATDSHFWVSGNTFNFNKSMFGLIPFPYTNTYRVTLESGAISNFGSYFFTFTTESVPSPNINNMLFRHYGFNNNLSNMFVGPSAIPMNGGVTYQPGKIDQAAYFNGTGNLKLNSFDIPPSNYSIAFWFKPEFTGFTNGLISFSNGINADKYLFLSLLPNGKLFSWPSSMMYTLQPTVSYSNWNHVVFTRNKVTMSGKVFLNGMYVTNIMNQTMSSPTFYIGADNTGMKRFKGLIDDFRIYSREITGAEVAMLMNPSNMAPPPPPNNYSEGPYPPLELTMKLMNNTTPITNAFIQYEYYTNDNDSYNTLTGSINPSYTHNSYTFNLPVGAYLKRYTISVPGKAPEILSDYNLTRNIFDKYRYSPFYSNGYWNQGSTVYHTMTNFIKLSLPSTLDLYVYNPDGAPVPNQPVMFGYALDGPGDGGTMKNTMANGKVTFSNLNGNYPFQVMTLETNGYSMYAEYYAAKTLKIGANSRNITIVPKLGRYFTINANVNLPNWFTGATGVTLEIRNDMGMGGEFSLVKSSSNFLLYQKPLSLQLGQYNVYARAMRSTGESHFFLGKLDVVLNQTKSWVITDVQGKDISIDVKIDNLTPTNGFEVMVLYKKMGGDYSWAERRYLESYMGKVRLYTYANSKETVTILPLYGVAGQKLFVPQDVNLDPAVTNMNINLTSAGASYNLPLQFRNSASQPFDNVYSVYRKGQPTHAIYNDGRARIDSKNGALILSNLSAGTWVIVSGSPAKLGSLDAFYYEEVTLPGTAGGVRTYKKGVSVKGKFSKAALTPNESFSIVGEIVGSPSVNEPTWMYALTQPDGNFLLHGFNDTFQYNFSVFATTWGLQVVGSSKNVTLSGLGSTNDLSHLFREGSKTVPNEWSMFSVPYQKISSNTNAGSTLITAKEVFPATTTNGESPVVYEWVTTPLNDYVISSNLQVGKSYWVKTPATEIILPPVGTKPVSKVLPFEMNLVPGWNMVASPFDFSFEPAMVVVEKAGLKYTLADAINQNILDKDTWMWVNNSYAAVRAPAAWQGFWWWANSDLRLLIYPVSVWGTEERTTSSIYMPSSPSLAQSTEAEGDFLMNVSATVGNASDVVTTIGARTSMSDLYGAEDQHEPPYFKSYISAASVIDSGLFNTDIKSSVETIKEWPLIIRTDKKNQEVTLSFSLLSGGSGLKYYLIDAASGDVEQIGSGSQVTFNSGAGQKAYKLAAVTEGNEELVKGAYEMKETFAFPNPATESVTIRAIVSTVKTAGMVVRIYSPSQKLVHQGYMSASDDTTWDYKWDFESEGLKPGVYLYKVSAIEYGDDDEHSLIGRIAVIR